MPFEVCGALVEEAIREALSGRFFKGTVEETLAVARGKVGQLRADLIEAEKGARGLHGRLGALTDFPSRDDQWKGR
ncbi:hypothetical protein ACFY4C_36590 [Actinomadura viridis]|uniref:hypothetical protein n=1 Tax=Actinomadura viridis TaxID=58110 RepID=UPI0036B62077